MWKRAFIPIHADFSQFFDAIIVRMLPALIYARQMLYILSIMELWTLTPIGA